MKPMPQYTYSIRPHPEGLGFQAVGKKHGKIAWISQNHSSEELCEVEIRKHQAMLKNAYAQPPDVGINYRQYQKQYAKRQEKPC